MERVDEIKTAMQALEQQLTNLQAELHAKEDQLRRTFQEVMSRTKLGEVDQVKLDEFFRIYPKRPYAIVSRRENEALIACPIYIPLNLGWLERQDGAYNIFRVNQYVPLFQPVPADLMAELELQPRFDGLTVHAGTLRIQRPDQDHVDAVYHRYAHYLQKPAKGAYDQLTAKPGQEFWLIAALIRDGILPFTPAPVDPKDLIDRPLKFEFRPYQQRDYAEWLRMGVVGLMYPMGAGKSFVALAAIDRLKGRKLILVPTRTLQEQWHEYLRDFTNQTLEEVLIEVYHKNTMQRLKSQEFMFICFDEMHRLPAETFLQLATLKAKYRMNLTGSPWREDGRSLGYDEPILVRLSGQVRMMQVGDLIDDYLGAKDTANTYNLEVLAHCDYQVRWQSVSQVSRHPVNRHGVIKVRLGAGRSVSITKGHSLMTIGEDLRIVPKACNDLKKGDRVLIPRRIPSEGAQGTPEEASLLGWYVAEGTAGKQYTPQGWVKSYQVSYSLNRNDEEGISEIQRALRSLGSSCSVQTDPRSDGIKVVAGKMAYQLIEAAELIGLRAHTKRVPQQIWNYTRGNQTEFLRAYHRGDAGVTVNEHLASDIAYLYLMAGEFPLIWTSLSRGTAVFPDGHRIHQSCLRHIVQPTTNPIRTPFRYLPVSYLDIFKPIRTAQRVRDPVKRFNSFSQETLDTVMGRDTTMRLRIVTFTHLHGFIDTGLLAEISGKRPRTAEAFLRMLGKRHFLIKTTEGHRWVGRARWRVTGLGEKMAQNYLNLLALFDGDFLFAPVKEIKTIDYEHKYVYDFHVPDSETFVAGHGGVLCHNSDLVLALSGKPLGVDWQYFLAAGVIHEPVIRVHISRDYQAKLVLLGELLAEAGKTMVFCDSLSLGHQLSRRYGVPFVYGETKERLDTIRTAEQVIVSRVADLGISIKDLKRVIEVDFLYGSRVQEAQRIGRLFHARKAGEHHLLMTMDEYQRYQKRLWGIQSKGFRIQLVRHDLDAAALDQVPEMGQRKLPSFTGTERRRAPPPKLDRGTYPISISPAAPTTLIASIADAVKAGHIPFLSDRAEPSDALLLQVLGCPYARAQQGLRIQDVATILDHFYVKYPKGQWLKHRLNALYDQGKIQGRRESKGIRRYFHEGSR